MTTGRTRFTLATAIVLIVAALPALAAAQARGAAGGGRGTRNSDSGPTPSSLGIHGFSVVLVIGGTQAAANPADAARDTGQVPEAARKALADMKDFLPYKRYQLLDAAWILCCTSNTTQVSGKVRGPDGRDYLYTVDPDGVVGSKLTLRFMMREVVNSITSSMNVDRLSATARVELGRQHAEAYRELDEARLQLRTTKQRFDVGTATPSEVEGATARARRAEQRVADLANILNSDNDRRFSGVSAEGRGSVAAGGRGGGARGPATAFGRETIDSSFSISPGETVVIGTSRINGDQALIAILTAATKPGAGR
jgi:hypothetical protein